MENNSNGVNYYEWKVLVVDDEEDVHHVTELAFEDIAFEEKPLRLLNAYSAAQARELLAKNEDIALILLDVVMENNHAGLELVKYIREDLNRKDIRIVLRTGYPGLTPEINAIRDYDINDYWEKTDLTAEKMHVLTISGLRAHKLVVDLETEISFRKKAEKENEALIGELKQALAKIKTLSGLLPICSHCKKIRDKSGEWDTIESYINQHSEASLSHSICPDCATKHYADYKIYDGE